MLLHAHDKPKLTRWSDNVRILELLAQNDIMDEQEAQALTRAYTTLRDELHHGIAGTAGPRGAGLFYRRARPVTASWQKWLVEPCVTKQV